MKIEDNIAGTAIPIDLMMVDEKEISASICSMGLDACCGLWDSEIPADSAVRRNDGL